jgi:anti-sigma regulatory factor (Ser/Thr protein kinase)
MRRGRIEMVDRARAGPVLGRLLTDARDGSVDWFAVADAVGEQLVPQVADWCVLQVRCCVLRTLREGHVGPLHERVGEPQHGEALEMVALRHHDGNAEAALRARITALVGHVGDDFGAGRVTATGASRYTPHVTDAHLRAAAASPGELAAMAALGMGSTIVVALYSGAVCLGALTLVRAVTAAPFTLDDVEHAEGAADVVGQALDLSRPTTIHAGRACPKAGRREATWRPPALMDASIYSAARAWARLILPELLLGPPSPSVYDDIDLTLTELLTNAVRHGGGITEVTLAANADNLRITVGDHDTRTPVIRPGFHPLTEGGRGMRLISVIADDWGVHRRHDHPGKQIWATFTTRLAPP